MPNMVIGLGRAGETRFDFEKRTAWLLSGLTSILHFLNHLPKALAWVWRFRAILAVLVPE